MSAPVSSSATPSFKQGVTKALGDADLQRALGNVKAGFIEKRSQAAAKLPEFETLRDEAKAIKDHTLDHLPFYLERYEEQVLATGGQVHWCETPAAARETILSICRAAGAKTVTKGKSMISEEIGLNDFLAVKGIEPIETDLGEYIIQLRKEAPSHIIAPAVHVTKDMVEKDFRKHHPHLDPNRNLDEARALVSEARDILRERFQAADVGITGANFLIAETGSSIIVTNEGNGDLTQILPRVHIVIASLEKVVPTFNDALTILRVLARSATGQDYSTYTTVSTGPKRPEDLDGPEEYHVVLLDNGRSSLLGGKFRDVLRCIRCGACMNHCPVYHAIGGHAYGWVYPGPIGAVLTPGLAGIEQHHNLPNASTFCGRCEAVCPMRIPLPKMMRYWREEAYGRHLTSSAQRWGLGVWAFLAARPALYRLVTALGAGVLGALCRGKGRTKSLPLAGAWTRARDFPAPEGRSFHALYRKQEP